MRWTVWGSHPSGDKIFHTHSDRNYTDGTESVPVVKRMVCGLDHPFLSSAGVKDIVKLYNYSASGHFWSV